MCEYEEERNGCEHQAGDGWCDQLVAPLKRGTSATVPRMLWHAQPISWGSRSATCRLRRMRD